METKESTFLFHWKDGKTDESKGRDPADAFTRLGYGAGALAALDCWEEKTSRITFTREELT